MKTVHHVYRMGKFLHTEMFICMPCLFTFFLQIFPECQNSDNYMYLLLHNEMTRKTI